MSNVPRQRCERTDDVVNDYINPHALTRIGTVILAAIDQHWCHDHICIPLLWHRSVRTCDGGGRTAGTHSMAPRPTACRRRGQCRRSHQWAGRDATLPPRCTPAPVGVALHRACLRLTRLWVPCLCATGRLDSHWVHAIRALVCCTPEVVKWMSCRYSCNWQMSLLHYTHVVAMLWSRACHSRPRKRHPSPWRNWGHKVELEIVLGPN